MPELEITDEQAAYLDDLRDAIESEIVGPYGTVRRKDALQYLIDDFGPPDDLDGSSVPADPVNSDATEDETDDEDAESDEEGGETEADTDTADDSDGSDDEGEDDTEEGDANGDDMLDEMMSLLDTHDDKWTEADTEETKYEVELPDGESETVQTQDDVRALLFKHYR